MGMITGLFNKYQSWTNNRALNVNPYIKCPLSLQILFDEALEIDTNALCAALRSFHADMKLTRVDQQLCDHHSAAFSNLVGWGKHVIRMVGYNRPLPLKRVQGCSIPDIYQHTLKGKAADHVSHVRISYLGYETSPLEQYVCLAALAGVLHRFGALVVLNVNGATCFPVQLLAAESQSNRLTYLRALPLPLLYCGFIKYKIKNSDQCWMRTSGANL